MLTAMFVRLLISILLYSVVVQAFNEIGKGPLSDYVKADTARVQRQPPDEVTCTSLTSRTILVSWDPPPTTDANGVIKGYKVIYGPSDSWFDEKTKYVKVTASNGPIILHYLKIYTNYTIEVLAFTSGGDGVSSKPVQCLTEQDVPEAPNAVKALVHSSDSILISWKPSTKPNGIINYYIVYYKQVGTDGKNELKSKKIAPYPRHQYLNYLVEDLVAEAKYEFWVTAETTTGEGHPSRKVTLSPTSRVPAKIASFDDTFTITYREDVTLPCLAVGVPAPKITWKIKGVQFGENEHMRKQLDGSLLIRAVSRTDAGEYSCHAENESGNDTVTHELVVLAAPHAPQVTLTSRTNSSLTIKLRPHGSDVDTIKEFTIHYRSEFGDWETIQVKPIVEKYTLGNLYCSSKYQLYVTAKNSIGSGDPSETINAKTKGEKPIIPSTDKFIEASSYGIKLHLNSWLDGGCPMFYFVIEYKKKSSNEWIDVSNKIQPGERNFVLLGLEPATWYHLRVTAHNNAGFNVAEYEFATLTISGKTT